VDKAPEAFRTISEVADEIDVPQHVLRFWESRFTQIRPMKRGGGRRYYRPDDVDLLRGVRHLLYGEGYTIRAFSAFCATKAQLSFKMSGAPVLSRRRPAMQPRPRCRILAAPRSEPDLSLFSLDPSDAAATRPTRIWASVANRTAPIAAGNQAALGSAIENTLRAALDELVACRR